MVNCGHANGLAGQLPDVFRGLPDAFSPLSDTGFEELADMGLTILRAVIAVAGAASVKPQSGAMARASRPYMGGGDCLRCVYGGNGPAYDCRGSEGACDEL